MKKKLRYISLLLTTILFLFVVLFIQHSEDETPAPIESMVSKDSIPENKIQFGINTDSFKIIQSTIQKNEFLANILLPFHIDYSTIDALAKKSRSIFDVRKIAVGKKYTILASKDSLQKAQFFIYQPNAIEYIVYDLRDTLNIYKEEKEVTIERKTIAGTISSSLYETLQQANASPYLAIKLSEIFAWSIDFYRIQKGDWFKAIYEVKYVDGESVGVGNVLAVEFNHFNNSFLAYFFQHEETEDYFDDEANSLRKAFLKSPLKFSRLSSRFTMRRFHPVQKRWKAHLGTDYAAPKGTPIMSTGDGVVIESKYKSANGNYVKVKHNSVYTTQYLHMSKRNVKTGQRVRQGDILGFVGSTGLATGPHVCYRFWKNGKQVDHLREEFPSAEPIKKEYKTAFDSLKNSLQQELLQLKIDQKDQLAKANS